MKIWLVNHYALPPSGPGGTRHHSLATKLMQRGHKIMIVAANVNHYTGEAKPVGKNGRWIVADEDGIPFLWIATPRYRGNSIKRIMNMVTFALRFSSSVQRAGLWRPDVILGSTVHPLAALAAAHYAHCKRIPFVYEERDLWPQTLIDLGAFSRWHPMIMILALLQIHLYRRAQQIVTVLPEGAKYVEQKGISSEKVSWIPNGVDLSLVPRPLPPDDSEPFVIAFAGQVVASNGLSVLLDAARKLKASNFAERILFRIYGLGHERDSLMAEKERDNLVNIEFRNPVPKVKVHAELMKAHAFFLYLMDSPLFRWGFSTNKLFDYLACARPILLASSSPYDPITSAKAGLTVHPRNLDAIVEAIKHFASMSRSSIWDMGQSGRRYVEEHHDYEKLALKLEKVFLRCVAP